MVEENLVMHGFLSSIPMVKDCVPGVVRELMIFTYFADFMIVNFFVATQEKRSSYNMLGKLSMAPKESCLYKVNLKHMQVFPTAISCQNKVEDLQDSCLSSITRMPASMQK